MLTKVKGEMQEQFRYTTINVNPKTALIREIETYLGKRNLTKLKRSQISSYWKYQLIYTEHLKRNTKSHT